MSKTPGVTARQATARQVKKVGRYSEDALGSAITQAVEHYGHVPTATEFMKWRVEQRKLNASNGVHHVPCYITYRNYYGTWEQVLTHFGYELEQKQRNGEKARHREQVMPDGLRVAKMAEPREIPPLSELQVRQVCKAYENPTPTISLRANGPLRTRTKGNWPRRQS